MTIAKNGQPILDLPDWSKRAGPKRSDQWREGRSAMEVAKSWLAARPRLPDEISVLLASHPAFATVEHWKAEPEVRVPFDDLPGEPRNADLIVHASDRFGHFVLAVEAKADESFGETVADALAAAVERKLENPRSNGIARVERLAESLFGPRRKGEPLLRKLRYQLLTASAGAIRAGKAGGASRVVLLVHEFWTELTTDSKHAKNATDLNCFVHRLSHGGHSVVEAGILYGPFEIPGRPLFEAPPLFFIGKAKANLRTMGG